MKNRGIHCVFPVFYLFCAKKSGDSIPLQEIIRRYYAV